MNYIGMIKFYVSNGIVGCLTAFFIGIGICLSSSAKEERIPDRDVPSGFADFGYKEGPIQYSGPDTADVHQAIDLFQRTTYREYILSEGDEIFVDVFNHEELSGTFTIGPDGKKTLPVAGIVKLAGLTREEAAQRISEKLAPQFQTQITVLVRVDKYMGNRIQVFGGVVTPGSYLFHNRPTLLDVITTAGGIPVPQTKATGTPAPKPYTIYCTVIRGDEQLSMIDISQLISHHDLSLNLRLQQNDIVHIHQLKTTPLYIMGEVRRPGYYNVTPNMTLLDALTQAGSITDDAAKKRIHVVHMNGYSHEVINLFQLAEPDATLDVLLEPGDLVYVPKNWLAVTNYWLSQIFGFITRPIAAAGAVL